MRFLIAAASAAILLTCSAAPATSSSKHVLHEKREGRPHSWQKRSRADAEHVMPIRIALRERNIENAEKYIYDVADPRSPNFGKHWSAEKVANTFAPHPETKNTVMNWLEESGIEKSRMSLSTGHNWVQFEGTVEEAERLFATEYWHYQHLETGGSRLACDHYSLPEHIQEHVDFAMPTIQLEGLQPVANAITSRDLMTEITDGAVLGTYPCGELVTIDCLRALYNFGPGNTSAAGNKMGIGEWADYLYEPDLPIFFKNFTSPQIPANVTPEFISIDGGLTANLTTVSQDSGIESALDFQSAYSIIYPQQLRLYQVGDGVNVDSVGTFNIWLDALDASYCTYEGGDQPYVDPAYPDPNDNEGGYTGPLQCGGAPISNVLSVSYGQIEGALPYFYQVRQCNEWMKLALQGVSVLFASGDSGVANRYNAGYPNSCLNSEELYVDINGTRYSPSFPGNCPYITTVGATQLITNDTSDGESATTDFGSGGGFSNVFPLPSYQSTAVGKFMEKYAPDYGPNVYNDTGNARGFPDVSAVGWQVVTVFNGSTYGVGGTSASAPIFAGIVTLLNEDRIAAGKGPIGFLNPTLYANPDAFNDITIGNNAGCGSGGFNATPGWDPVTGLGTPDYEKLKAVFLALP
ncbi:subtilisin-like protein [Cryphonectria parasitica EP155]|uniref:tripeptidyl-peptidase II n=1 Tax=Cryphonectria parasitica (strain ATCC 38755 / EP155) TaxID=660469 RepID=A0A9P4Y1B6_CRYP1|nr:subtilisin-like protein [Cryphonectria parasitica EP155]KAF3764746.1 subtilisin-like protein [Cryphonectria parasitica EP155]